MTGFKQIKKATPSILTYPTSVTQEKNIKKKKNPKSLYQGGETKN